MRFTARKLRKPRLPRPAYRKLMRYTLQFAGHLKSDGLVERNRLLGAHGDAINAILAAAGHNLRLLVAWLRALCALLWAALVVRHNACRATPTPA